MSACSLWKYFGAEVKTANISFTALLSECTPVGLDPFQLTGNSRKFLLLFQFTSSPTVHSFRNMFYKISW